MECLIIFLHYIKRYFQTGNIHSHFNSQLAHTSVWTLRIPYLYMKRSPKHQCSWDNIIIDRLQCLWMYI